MAQEPQQRNAVERSGFANALKADRSVPPAVGERYIREGNWMLFPDRTPAIEDRGTRLVSPTGNPQVARDLIAIAQSRGWDRIEIRGTESFRREAARAAIQLGLQIASGRPASSAAPTAPALEPRFMLAVDAPTRTDPSSDTSSRTQNRVPPEGRAPRAPGGSRAGDIVTGTFVTAGEAPYRFDAANGPSFFVRVETRTGRRDIWGTDLKRALAASASNPQPGDTISVQRRGSTVVEPEGNGSKQGKEPRRRNEWRIESAEFFDDRRVQAQALRSGTEALRTDAANRQPLQDALVVLKAAELFAQLRIPSAEDRVRFETAVRQTLASTIELGDRLPAIRVRRSPDRQTPAVQQRLPLDRTDPVPAR
jgi:hypothetical protein